MCEDSLGSNRLGQAGGAVALAAALWELMTLQTLEYVWGCGADDGGVLASGGRGLCVSCGGAGDRWCVRPCFALFGVGCCCCVPVSGNTENLGCDHEWYVMLCGV